MKCPICQEQDPTLDPYYGYLPCIKCQTKPNLKPGNIPEMVGDSIKEQRKANWDDIHPAHRKGVPSREFRDRWGKEAMKRQGYTDSEIKNAKYVWHGSDDYYKEGN